VGAGVCAVIYSFVVLFGEIKEGDANRRVYVNGNRVTSEGDFQDTLAEMIGNTRTRVNLFMNKFKKLVHYNGGIEVNFSLLRVVLHN
jgi:hypothetical protein